MPARVFICTLSLRMSPKTSSAKALIFSKLESTSDTPFFEGVTYEQRMSSIGTG